LKRRLVIWINRYSALGVEIEVPLSDSLRRMSVALRMIGLYGRRGFADSVAIRL